MALPAAGELGGAGITTGQFQTKIEDFLAAVTQDSFAGEIRLWYGNPATPPTGWLVCDGTNGTPDMRDRVPIGAGTYTYGQTAGAWSALSDVQGAHSHTVTVDGHVLTEPEMPSHRHQALTTDTLVANSGNITNAMIDGINIGNPLYADIGIGGNALIQNTGGNAAHNHTASSGATGGHNHSTSTIQPSLALVFLMRA